jgi:hypothetical protein
MTKLLLLVLPICLLSCRPNAADKAAQSRLDSLNGALGLELKAILHSDTVRMQKALDLYHQYHAFVAQSVHDTLTLEEANALKKFMENGAVLEAFLYNRTQLLVHGKMIALQAKKLTQDLASGSVGAEEMAPAIESESQAMSKTISTIEEERKKGAAAIIEMRNTLSSIEGLIKKRNNNQLPTYTADTSAF